jgi:hypothetical protein
LTELLLLLVTLEDGQAALVMASLIMASLPVGLLCMARLPWNATMGLPPHHGTTQSTCCYATLSRVSLGLITAAPPTSHSLGPHSRRTTRLVTRVQGLLCLILFGLQPHNLRNIFGKLEGCGRGCSSAAVSQSTQQRAVEQVISIYSREWRDREVETPPPPPLSLPSPLLAVDVMDVRRDVRD